MNEFIKVRSDIDDATFKKIKKLLKKIDKSEDDLVRRVAAVVLEYMDDDGKITLSPPFIAKVEDNVAEVLTDVGEAESEFIKEVLEDGYLTAHDKTSKLLGMSPNWNILRKEFVDAALNATIDGKRFSERIWDNTDDLANRIYEDILDCIRTGRRPNEIAKKIRDDFGVSRYEAARLVNTELARVTSTAQLDVYRNSGVVDSVMWMATLERNTCERCGELDGQIFSLKSVPAVPLHPNCRCCHVPLIDGVKPMKRAENEKHENIDYMTYQEWSKKNDK